MDLPARHLIELFQASLHDRAEKTALIWDDRHWTFGEIDAWSNRVATGLHDAGVAKGDRLGLFAGNSPEFVVTHLAHLKLGAITVPINVLYREHELTNLITDAGIRLLTTDAERLPHLESCRDRLGTLEDIRVIGEESWEGLGENAGDVPPVEIEPDDLALLAYTSGTTGRSKGAMLSHGNLMANILGLIETWRLSTDDRFLLCLPLFHLHGLGNGLNGWFATGMTTLLMPRFHAEPVLSAFEEQGITLFYGVPTMIARLLEAAGGEPHPLPHMRLVVSGSAPLSAEMHREFERVFGQRIVERYGMSETVMNLSNPHDGDRRPGSVGLPLPGVEVRLLDEEMNDLPDGEVGQIALRGPNVFRGYWQAPEKTEEAFHDGWFLTGDLAFREPDGYFTIVGRAKELIICGGFNVYPREIEDVLCEHAAVGECKCIGVAEPAKGEVVKAYVVCANGCEPPDPEALIAHCRERLASFKVPRGVQFVASLPKNALGKVVVADLPDREVL